MVDDVGPSCTYRTAFGFLDKQKNDWKRKMIQNLHAIYASREEDAIE